jgi:hypothetical protein
MCDVQNFLKGNNMFRWTNGFSEEIAWAEQGYTDASLEMLDAFADLADEPAGIHPELVRHIARCVRRWREKNYAEQEAHASFLIKS